MTAKDQNNTTKTKKEFYKKWWFWAVVIVVLIVAFSPKDATKQSTNSNTNSTTASTDSTAPAETKTPEPSVPTEYKSALAKATDYANTMNMSKQGVYDQLVSEYGEKFTASEADYAIKHLND